jgi:predicted transposase YbfD/YdcC
MRNYEGNIFGSVADTRVEGRCLHKLKDILFIALCTLMSNGQDFEDMVEFGKQRKEWLEEFLELPNGIPSHDTFNRCLQLVEPESLIEVMKEDGLGLIESLKGKMICLDGKKLKGASPKSKGNNGLYILNAWLSDEKICIGQERVDHKSNEITAIPKLLEQIDIKGSTISIDAMGCQRSVAKTIIEKEANYLLAVKKNQGELYEEIDENFQCVKAKQESVKWDYGHGRFEIRKCKIMSGKEVLSPNLLEKWEGLETIIELISERTVEDVTTTHTRYYISSDNKMTASKFNDNVRNHWSIENNLHWHLDITFNEDSNRSRTKNAPINLSIIRKIALHKIKKMQTKISLKKRLFRASLNQNYLIQCLELPF